jgi:hypothetical protein
LRLHSHGITKRRTLVLASLTALLAAALFGSQLSASSAAPAAKVETVSIKGEKSAATGGHLRLFFDAPRTVHQGDVLKIENLTNPRRVGPHTFAMVIPGQIPDTKPERKKCFSPNHICLAIAHWLGSNGRTPIKQNPAKAGKGGWDTEGSLTKKGDVWFTGNKPGTTFSQAVSAKPGTTITFMCAIHPFMHGEIKVLP